MSLKILKRITIQELKKMSKQNLLDIIEVEEATEIALRKESQVSKVTNEDILKLLQSHIEDFNEHKKDFNELKKDFDEHKKDFNDLSIKVDKIETTLENVIVKNNLTR